MRDAFFSEEDLDLRHLSFAELNRVWNAWLRQAQATNDRDAHEYSHGVFTREPVATATDHSVGREEAVARTPISPEQSPSLPLQRSPASQDPDRGPGKATLAER